VRSADSSPGRRWAGRWVRSSAMGSPSAVRTRSRCTTGLPGTRARWRATTSLAGTTAWLRTTEPGAMPLARMSSVKEVRVSGWRNLGSATKVPLPWTR
jgi:hypothetical protein